MRSTIEAIARDLTEDGLVLRYRNQEGLNADGLEGEEGTFVICSFWLVSCLAQAGEVERAEELFDQLAGYANDLGLLAEEIDTATGEQLGNFPQAFSHIGLIIAAYEIDYDYYLHKSQATSERGALVAALHNHQPDAPVRATAPEAPKLGMKEIKEQRRAEAAARQAAAKEERERQKRVAAPEEKIHSLEARQKKLVAETEETRHPRERQPGVPAQSRVGRTARSTRGSRHHPGKLKPVPAS